MIKLSKCNKLLNAGFSLITIGNKKIPNTKWKEQQINALNKSEFESRFNLPSTKGVGIVTGYDHLEVIDVDLKVFSTAKEQLDFWETFLSYLEDSIIDFHDKFCITKTKNKGYHIIYKSKRCQKNQKLAVLKGHKEAIIETRGIGGYVFIYENFLNNKYYTDIDWITDEDRNTLFEIIDAFDYKKVIDEPKVKDEKKSFKKDKGTWKGLTVSEDFNQKNTVLDVVSDDFKIVRSLQDRLVIKRHGGDSKTSGYIFHNNGCMFLHSTGTIYPHEDQVSAYKAYVYKYHNGNYSEASKKLYADGYGDRQKIPPPEISDDVLEEKKKLLKEKIVFPLEIFPKPYQNYIIDCHNTLDSTIDYMGCALLWSLSVIVGNSCVVEVKRNWIEKPIVWIACVGKAGIGKTPSINNIIRPLEKENQNEIKRFFNQLEKYEHFESLSKDEKKYSEEVKKPFKTQFIANDITVEALIQMHQESKNAVGIFKDELAGWFKDMNKYREGSDLELWLSSWSGKAINLNRVKTTSNAFLNSPFMPVLGGIQPSILNNFYTDENKDNGFIDRVLLSYPELKVEKYNDNEMSIDIINWYNNNITNLYRKIKKDVLINEHDEIDPVNFVFDDQAKTEWKRIFNKITDMQNSDETNEYLKSMLPKQKSYIPRFSILLHLLAIDAGDEDNSDKISKASILKAEILSDYFIKMAQKIKINAKESKSLKSIAKNDKLNNKQKVQQMLKLDSNFNKSEAAELLGISRQMIYKYLKK